MSKKTYQVIGLMSGSSLDGLDLAYCSFEVDTEADNPIAYWQLHIGETIPLSEKWQTRLFNLPQQQALTFAQTHSYFGHYTAELVNEFIKRHQLEVDFIAAHGHTIFHYPDKRVTVQIGDGAAIAALTGLPVVNNFRTQDIAINGEGTPLAPIADKLLFQGYDFYLNLGGIANITCNANGKYIAFDIGPANQVFNVLANQLELDFDRDGALAAQAQRIDSLWQQLNEMPYFSKPYPKSLDNNWIREEVFPLYFADLEAWENKLHTACLHLAYQTTQSIQQILTQEQNHKNNYRLLATGGGTKNKFLLQCIKTACATLAPTEVVVPSADVIDFKEAILIALMGVLRVENIPNCLQTVTGATHDTIGGSIFQGTKKFI
ncbi:MAG: anhydro-N-acetylmuramic acid kinase [Saprospiraceae bacterium]